ncbi:MAG: ATP synthase F0 subunit B [Deltaproteobacteria bacterium]|nr:ATP synthase F0 subunit B [Deltaproteobacteria bacterium]
MLHLLSPLGAAVQHTDVIPRACELTRLARAGLIDLDATIVTQAVFFFALLILLPGLVYKPLLARFDQREERTEGARTTAKAMRKQAREEVARYEAAVAAQRKDALAERAATRSQAQAQADAMVATARREAAERVSAGIAEQRTAAEAARQSLRAEAQTLGGAIADKLTRA